MLAERTLRLSSRSAHEHHLSSRPIPSSNSVLGKGRCQLAWTRSPRCGDWQPKAEGMRCLPTTALTVPLSKPSLKSIAARDWHLRATPSPFSALTPRSSIGALSLASGRRRSRHPSILLRPRAVGRVNPLGPLAAPRATSWNRLPPDPSDRDWKRLAAVWPARRPGLPLGLHRPLPPDGLTTALRRFLAPQRPATLLLRPQPCGRRRVLQAAPGHRLGSL